MLKKSVLKNIVICALMLAAVSLLTNYRAFYRFFYTGPEISLDAAQYRTDDHYYQIEDLGENVNVIQLVYHEKPYYVSVSYTSDEFRNYEHFNPMYETDRTGEDTELIYVSVNSPVKDLLIFIGNGQLDQIRINPRFAWQTNGRKTLAYWLLLLAALFVFKDGGPLCESRGQKARTAVLILTLSLMSYAMCRNYSDPKMDALYSEYVTDSLLAGKLELDYPVSEGLAAAADPYDTSARDYDVLWDASYYNGKYYSYFGILPAAVLLVPYKAVSGSYLSSSYSTLVYLVLCFISAWLLLKGILKRFFPETPYRLCVLVYLYIIFGSKLIWCIHRPLFYELVAVAAWFHVTAGLYLVLIREERIANTAGYLMLALAVLCRPTFLLASVLILPKLYGKLKEKKFGAVDIASLFLPYLAVGLFTMYLNYVRFGSVTEFGITYQLTANTLTNTGFSVMKALIGSLYYMFEGVNIRVLPLQVSGIANSFPIVTDFFTEAIGGGFMVVSVLGIFMIPLLKEIEDRKLKVYVYTALGLAAALLLIATGIGSLVGRYMLDFNYLLYFITAAVFLCALRKEKGRALGTVFRTGMVFSILLNFLLALSYI